MATPEQRARRAAQRATAARVRETRTPGGKYTPVISRGVRAGVRAAREAYANDVIAGREPWPAKGSPEAKNLASLAGKARWGKADAAYIAAFNKYWYHKDDESDADVEDNADYESDTDSGNDDGNPEELYPCRPTKSLPRAARRYYPSERCYS